MTADDIIELLSLEPHPEGGWYTETWRSVCQPRPSGTAIYFLLQAGEMSRWHRVDAAETWHFYMGAPLTLCVSETEDGPYEPWILGPDLVSGQRPQIVVPPDWWQCAESMGAYTLVGCTVSPGFQFEGFELAPRDFHIPG
ncbi:MAG: cupin domain-containing protein [Paracoccaceae bacterium]|nr:cupin domain-containing protein [Paracoccaceae bacterium]